MTSEVRQGLCPTELSRSRLAPLLLRIHRLLRGERHWNITKALFRVLHRLECGPCHSATMREILSRHFNVDVGAYSYGDCMIPGAFPPSVTVGRYTSVGPGVRVFNQ